MSFHAEIIPDDPIGMTPNPRIVIKKKDEFRPNTEARTMQPDSELWVSCEDRWYWVEHDLFLISNNQSKFSYDFGYPHESNDDGRRFSGNDGKGVDNWEVLCDTNRFNDLVTITHSRYSGRIQAITLKGYVHPTQKGIISLNWSQATPTDYMTGLRKGSTMRVYEAT